ncbi:MAG: TRAP transporter substrate-binding protein DctP [Alphaproteobacteria bacterium]
MSSCVGGRLGLTIGAAAFLAIGAVPALAAQVDGPKVNWNLSTFTKEGRGIASVFSETEGLPMLVGKATDGNFKIKVHYSEALAPAKEHLDSLKIGAFEMGLFSASLAPGKMPLYTAFDLPFLPLGDVAVQARVMLAYYRLPEAIKEAELWNVRLLLPGLLPAYEAMGKGKPPQNIADFKGLRVRAIGGQGEAMRKVGAVPTTMVTSEVYGALERGIIDAAMFPFYATHSYKLYEVSNWYTTNLALGVGASVVPVNLKAWNDLPPQYRKLIDDSVAEAVSNGVKAFADMQAVAVNAFSQKKLTPITFSTADVEQFTQQGGRPVWDAWVKEMEAKGLPGRKVLDFILAEAKKAGS